MPSFDFSILLVDKKTFCFPKALLESTMHVCVGVRDLTGFPSPRAADSAIEGGVWGGCQSHAGREPWNSVLLLICWQGIQDRVSFSFHFPKWSWRQLQSGSSGQGIRQSEEHPFPPSPGSPSSNTHPTMLSQSGSLGTHIFISIRRCSSWKFPLICSFIMNWKDKYWKIAAGASRESPGIKVSLGTCPHLSQHRISSLEKGNEKNNSSLFSLH